MCYYTLLLPPPHPVSALGTTPPGCPALPTLTPTPALLAPVWEHASPVPQLHPSGDQHISLRVCERTCRLCLGNAWKIWLQYMLALSYLLYCLKNIWPLLERARRDALQLTPEIAHTGLHNFAAKKHPFSSAACPCPWSSSGEEKAGLQSLWPGMNHRRKVS